MPSKTVTTYKDLTVPESDPLFPLEYVWNHGFRKNMDDDHNTDTKQVPQPLAPPTTPFVAVFYMNNGSVPGL